jgi:hypothetical protein
MADKWKVVGVVSDARVMGLLFYTLVEEESKVSTRKTPTLVVLNGDTHIGSQ